MIGLLEAFEELNRLNENSLVDKLLRMKADLREYEAYLSYLQNSGYREIGAGGNFESKEELDETIRETQKQIDKLRQDIKFLDPNNKIN